MDAESVTLDRDTFKALASQTRVSILKSLDSRRKTASELSHELGTTVQGISEHLHSLQQAGLVERKESGRKWVYYQLTSKGNAVLHPDAKKFWVLVALSILAFGAYFYSPILSTTEGNFITSENTQAMAVQGTPAPQLTAAKAPSQDAKAGEQTTQQAPLDYAKAGAISGKETLLLLAAALFLAGAGWIKFVKKTA